MKGHYMTFRCRLCGKTFTNGGTGDEWTARKAMANVALAASGIEPPTKLENQPLMHSATTISFTTMGNLTYCATQCIDVEGYGKIDGKYYMDSVGHTMNKSGGFVTKVSASRVGG